MRDSRPVVNDLVQGVFFFGLRRIENVDETICAGGEKEGRMRGVQLQGCDGVGV